MPHFEKSSEGSTDRYRLILENVRDFAIFSADLSGHINEWNPGAERFFGYKEQEILGQPMEILYVPEDRAAGRAELEKAQAAKTGYSEDERWHLRKDGTRFFVIGVVNAMYDDQDRLCGFIKVARDITARKVLEERLEASEAEHRLILEAIKDFAIITLGLDGGIQKWNPGAEVTFGYAQEEISGRNHALLFTAEEQSKGEPERCLAKAMHDGVSQAEHWQVRKDGEPVYVIDVLRAMPNGLGRVTSILKVCRDITERHRIKLQAEAAQKELEAIKSELEVKVAHRTAAQAQMVQSLEEVLYHVAHDLRAPLRTMEGFSSILVQRYGKSADPEAHRLTDLISEAAQRMDRLIHDLLIYGRLCHEPVARQAVGLQRAVEAALGDVEEEANQAQAEIRVDQGLPQVWGDQKVIQQVLCQLLQNALKFAAPARKLQLRIWTETKPGWVRLWVEDNGIGIDPQYLERIFWLFEQLSHGDTSSTGMGLPIAKKGMERMEGRIGVESEPALGSRFWIELPMPPAKAT